MRFFSTLCFSITFAVITTGCSKAPEPAKRVQVSGTVKLDGKPLQTGKVVFDAENGQPPTTCDILDGRYEGRVMLGQNRVKISSVIKMSMKEKMKMDGPGYDELSEFDILPDRYNVKSEILREVVEPGPNEFNFDLKSK